MGDIDWNLLRSFVAVAETGSLSAAARRIGSSQPTLGRHVAALESHCGTPLFRRDAGRQELTDIGAELLAEARRMRAAADALQRRLAGADVGIDGPVRITASVVVGTLVLPRLLAPLMAAHPGLEVEIAATDNQENLLRRDADIAIRMVRPSQDDLVARHVADIAIVAAAAKSYLDVHGRPERAEQLLEHRVLGLDRGEEILRGFAALGHTVARGFFKLRSDNHLLLWEALKAGLGVGFAQRTLVDAAPDVEAILPDLTLPPLPVWLTVHQDLRNTPRFRLVADFLADALRDYARSPASAWRASDDRPSTTMNRNGSAMKIAANPVCSATKPRSVGANRMPE
jgi:DNA-binding transcriptional LysR family regulator